MERADAEGHKPPEDVARAAARGLDYRSRPGGGGGTAVGVARARDLSARRSVSSETIGRMVSFFARHEKNAAVSPEHKGEPWRDRGHVSWLLWGGNAGRRWAEGVQRKLEKKKTDLRRVDSLTGPSMTARRWG